MKRAFPYLLLGALSLLLYVNTIHHGFVLDDEVVITRNAFVQNGIGGFSDILSNDSFGGFDRVGPGKSVLEGGRYRPLSLLLFAVVYEFAGPNASAFHVVAIFLYMGLVLMLYKLFRLLLKGTVNANVIALFAAALFAVHPVHTEVVANIKSCDETLALLFGVIGMYAMVKAFDDKPKNWMAISVVSMVLACMAKESAVALAVAGPLALWFFRKTSIRQVVTFGLPMVAGALLFVVLRTYVLSQMQMMDMGQDPLNDPFLTWDGNAWIAFTMTERVATIAFTAWKYLQLLLFPYPLTHDYYPFVIEAHAFKNVFDWLGIIVLLSLVVGGVWSMWKRIPMGFCLLFYFITLVVALNIFFPIGTFMAERFLFMPSVGFCLGAVILAVKWKPQFSGKVNWVLAPALVIIGLFAVMTLVRNRDWKNNMTLFESALINSAASVKLQNEYGTMKLDQALVTPDSVWRKALIDTAFTHLQIAVSKHPTYYDAMLAFGAAAYYKGEHEYAVQAYQRGVDLSPQDNKAVIGLYYSLQSLATKKAEEQKYSEALQLLQKAQQIMTDTSLAKRITDIENQIK